MNGELPAEGWVNTDCFYKLILRAFIYLFSQPRKFIQKLLMPGLCAGVINSCKLFSKISYFNLT